MTKEITQGRYKASILPNGDRFAVLVTRDGQCLPGIGMKFYTDMKRAITGANRLLGRAAA